MLAGSGVVNYIPRSGMARRDPVHVTPVRLLEESPAGRSVSFGKTNRGGRAQHDFIPPLRRQERVCLRASAPRVKS
jgi:hypothetical protein